MEGSQASGPRTWIEWYRFAADELGFLPEECVEYANLRYVEEQNRASLREAGSRRSRVPVARRPGLHMG